MQSVMRMTAIMNALAGAGRPLSIMEIAEVVKLDRAVVHRIVAALAGEGYVERERLGRYQVGPLAMVYASAYVDGLAVRRVGLPYALELRERLGRDLPIVVSLNIRVGAEITVVDAVWDDQVGLDSILQVGTRFPIDRSSTGRCILAYLPREKQEELLGERLTSSLTQRLTDIRAAGGIDSTEGDVRAGISGLAAVILDRHGDPIAAMSVYGSDSEISGLADPKSQVGVALRRTVDAIGFALSGPRAQAAFDLSESDRRR